MDNSTRHGSPQRRTLSLHEISSPMRQIRIPWLAGALLVVSIGVSLQAGAQIDNLPIIPSVNIPISPQALGDLEEDEIPTREELRLLGLSEDEIDVIFENLEALEEPDPLDTYEMGQDALRAPTPVQGDGATTGSGETTATVTDLPDSAIVDPAILEAPELIYGHKLLRTPLTTESVVNPKPPSNYVLKSGDQVTITAYGPTDFQGIYNIHEDGYIYQKEAGRMYIAGMELGDARVLLRNRWSRFMNLTNSTFDVSITYSPVIRVNIVGEVAQPGTYSISSWNSALNALAYASGPTDLGSVRKIEVRREGETIKILDVYKFLMDPASNQDFFLQDNDYLVVQPHGKTVAISGQINRPHTYELLDHEHLGKLISYAAGLKPAAYTRNIQVQRFANSQRVVINVDYDSLATWGGDFDLFDGDVVWIDTLPETFENYVEVRGDVNFPGPYELRPGYRVSDVLARAQGNGKYDRIDQAYLIRLDEDFNPRNIPIDIDAILADPDVEDNVLLEERDVIEVIGKVSDDFTVAVEGAVRSPGEYTYATGMTLKDLLFYAGGPKTEAAVDRIEVARVVEYDVSSGAWVPTQGAQIQTVAIGFDLQNDAAAEEYVLQPYDRIFVHVAEGFDYQQQVTLVGEVRFPGVYTLSGRDESVVDLIERAGGLTATAFADGASMFRNGGVGLQDDYTRLVLELDRAMRDPTSPYNHILVEGDSIIIPKMMDYVALSGFMYNPEIDTANMISVPFERGKRAGYYVNQYGGGFDRRARRNKTLVIEPNGRVRRTKEILWINIYPKVTTEGAQIVAVEKLRPETRFSDDEKPPFDWNLFVSTLSAGILSFATIYALVSRNSQ